MKNAVSWLSLWESPLLVLMVTFRRRNAVNLGALWRTQPLLGSRTVLTYYCLE